MPFINISTSPFTTSISYKKIAVVALLSVLTLSACSDESSSDVFETVNENLGLDEEDVFSLKAGSCFDNPRESSLGSDSEEYETISSIPMRECDEPHDNEAYYAYDLVNTETYQQVESEENLRQIDETCTDEFEKYLGIPYDDSYYVWSTYSPTEESWLDGDNEILCYLSDPDEVKIPQSLKGSKL